MKLSELQKKDIVNIKDGKVIGRIIDVEIDETGYLIHFVIEKSHFFHNIFSSSEELHIKFAQIKKLGEDVILIDIGWNNTINVLKWIIWKRNILKLLII